MLFAALAFILAGCTGTPGSPNEGVAGSGLNPHFFRFPAQTAEYDSPPVFLKGDAPPYPWPLLMHVPRPIRGHATLSFTIDERGRAVHPHTVETTHPYFASAVATAMRGWRFKPAEKAGMPVAVVVPHLRFEFTEFVGGDPLKQ
ncbi:energy transducer TonB [Horticoccus luteus]|uniref:Energy transducer TonB n=1 Tax=Horticoccus luteus TaxID=2862869 RepID=A0A8F9TVF5_9BACT|nr:energy transducer TonB [Horticoccus luteus]QYM79994.1 energy transducer TonB [Horticoccus luteus]